MRVRYSPRARTDIAVIGARSRSTYGIEVAAVLATYIRASVTRIAANPEIGESVSQRAGVRMLPLARYPFKIFYTISQKSIVILHIRHTSRRPWNEN